MVVLGGTSEKTESAAMLNMTFLNKTIVLVALIAISSLSIGCRNCRQPCAGQYGLPQPGFGQQPGYVQPGYVQPSYVQPGVQPGYVQPGMQQNYQPPAFPGFGANGIIPPPPTGSLNIPSVARNPYPYNNYRNGLNPNGSAPTPANGSGVQNYNRSNGWRSASQTGNGLGAVAPSPQPTTNSSNAVSVIASRSDTNDNSGQIRTASNPSSTSSGSSSNSYIDSPNYTTTSINETMDRTRLPATDASGMRAPSQYYQSSTGNRLAQNVGQNVGQFVSPSSGYQNPNYYNPGINRNAYAPQQGYVGQFARVPGAYQAPVTPPTVLAQSTTVYDPYRSGSTRQADWRDREEAFR